MDASLTITRRGLQQMTQKSAKKQLQLTTKEIERTLLKRLRPYDKLSFLEQFAMFMGKAQVLELGLKQLLARRYGCDFDQMERWALGRTAIELKQRGVRKDFIDLLESLVERRNFVAHELLAGDALIKLLTGRSTRAARRSLQHAIYELERILLLHDWLGEHAAWALTRKPTHSVD